MGARAVQALVSGAKTRVIVYTYRQFKNLDLEEALKMEKAIPEYQLDIADILMI